MTSNPAPAAIAGPGTGGGAAQAHGEVLELRVADLRQLFNSMDPAPFRERDLDPKAQAYIVDWARELKAGLPLALVVHVGNASALAEDTAMLREAVAEYFAQRARATYRQLQQLFRVGRISLLIGLAFLAAALVIGESIVTLFSKERYVRLVQESLMIGGWVALWRPLEIFLYDWWPIRNEARLYERLCKLDVRLLAKTAEGRASP